MPEGLKNESLFNVIAGPLADRVQYELDKGEVSSSRIKRLFGREKPVHNLLGGGKSADVLLWRNKKISASVLASATAIWVLFEWLNYHFVTLLSLLLFIGMLIQFLLSNASWLLNRGPSKIPRISIPDEIFMDLGISFGISINNALGFLQDISCGGSLKQFLIVIGSLWAAAMIGSCCNFLTVLYIGFVSIHTLPILYERYEDQVDNFVYDLFEQLRSKYQKIDAKVLTKFPSGRLKRKVH